MISLQAWKRVSRLVHVQTISDRPLTVKMPDSTSPLGIQRAQTQRKMAELPDEVRLNIGPTGPRTS